MNLTVEHEVLALRLGATCAAVAKWRSIGRVPEAWRLRLKKGWAVRNDAAALAALAALAVKRRKAKKRRNGGEC